LSFLTDIFGGGEPFGLPFGPRAVLALADKSV
jgi:hypothetical protein